MAAARCGVFRWMGRDRNTPCIACGNPAVPSTCAPITVPEGGPELLILNSEFRIPLPIHKGLGVAAFYDGGNVFSDNRISMVSTPIQSAEDYDMRHQWGRSDSTLATT